MKRSVLARFVAQQLSAPSGITGRWVLAPLWNRRNAALNDVVFDSLVLHSHDRVLEIGFGYGSEWQLLRWLGYHRGELARRANLDEG